ncbi:MAG TPA: pilus assembly protein PilB, partial [Planctomycetaceae bacterium]|nr:pilus assembly protein PilB [Planctomycetaceae bacterium]
MAKWMKKLVSDGHISADQLQEALAISKSKGKKPEAILQELGYVTKDTLREYQSAALGYEMIDLTAIEPDPSVIEQVPESVARENIVFPVEMRGESLVVAMNDPMNLEVLDKLRFILNRDIQVVVASMEAIQAAINTHYGQHETESVDSIIAEFTETAIDFTETELSEAEAEAEADETSPIVRLVNLIISEAINMRASDIHVEPFDDRIRIRYRIDG